MEALFKQWSLYDARIIPRPIAAVYVFTRTGTTWSQQAYIKASNTNPADYFGSSVSLSGDSLVVGAWGEDSNATGINGNPAFYNVGNSGAVCIFTRTGSAWSQEAYMKSSNPEAADQFGGGVSLSGDSSQWVHVMRPAMPRVSTATRRMIPHCTAARSMCSVEQWTGCSVDEPG